MVSLNSGWGAARLRQDQDGKDWGMQLVTFRMAPGVMLHRFGAAGAQPVEFRAGDRVRLELQVIPARPAAKGSPARPVARYAGDVSDEVTFQ